MMESMKGDGSVTINTTQKHRWSTKTWTRLNHQLCFHLGCGEQVLLTVSLCTDLLRSQFRHLEVWPRHNYVVSGWLRSWSSQVRKLGPNPRWGLVWLRTELKVGCTSFSPGRAGTNQGWVLPAALCYMPSTFSLSCLSCLSTGLLSWRIKQRCTHKKNL